VLDAMGESPEVGRGTVRLSVGRFTTEDQIDRAAQALIAQAKRVGFSQKLKSWFSTK